MPTAAQPTIGNSANPWSEAEILLANGVSWLPIIVELRESTGELCLDDVVPGREPSPKNLPIASPSDKRSTPSSTIRRVEVKKNEGEGLGVSIKGGVNHSMPIVISKIFEGMAADRTRQLFVGDMILTVNDSIDLRRASHDQAVKALRSAGRVVILHVQYYSAENWAASKKHLPGEAGRASFSAAATSTPSPTTAAAQQQAPYLGDVGWGPLNALEGGCWRRVLLLRLASIAATSKPTQTSPSQSPDQPPDDLIDAESADESRILRIYSPDGNRMISLRFPSDEVASTWLQQIDTMLGRLGDIWAGQLASADIEPLRGIHRVGWLDLMFATEDANEQTFWKRVFVMLNQTELLLFDKAPSLPLTSVDQPMSAFRQGVEAWAAQNQPNRIPLLFSRLVSAERYASLQSHESGSLASLLPTDSQHVFGLRTARVIKWSPSASSPIESRAFRCPTANSSTAWYRAILTGCHNAVAASGRIRFSVLLVVSSSGDDDDDFDAARLTSSLELSDETISLNVVNDTNDLSWSKPWSALSGSSDDTYRSLRLEIRGLGRIRLEVGDVDEAAQSAISKPRSSKAAISPSKSGHAICFDVDSPKPIVFAIHSFLSAKLATLGIVA